MDKTQFIVEPSEIEQQYTDLFAPMEVEGLEAPIQSIVEESKSKSESKSESKPKMGRDSTVIRKKIEQRKLKVQPKARNNAPVQQDQ